MFTLMPVAAFAAPENYAVKVQVGSEAYTEDVAVTAGTTMSVLAFDASNNALAAGAYYAVNADGEGVQIKYDANGNGEVFAFKLPGTYTIYGVEDTSSDLQGLVTNANSLTSDETVAGAVAKIEAQLDAKIIKTVAYVTVEAPESNYVVAVTENNGTANDNQVSVLADSGFTGNVQVTVQLTNNTKPVVGKVPTITAPDYLTITPVSAKKVVTDAAGKITYNISANRAGNFEVVFGYEDAADVAVKVVATDSNVANVEVVKEAANPINKVPSNGYVNTGATLKFTDANGSVIPVVSPINADNLDNSDMIKVTVVSQPATSKLTGDNFELVASQTAGASDLKVATSVDLKVGSYEVKLALANGKSATVAFEIAKMGDVVGIRFVQPATTVALGADAPNFTIQSYDAKGVTGTASVDLSANGKALVTANAGKLFTVSNEDKFIGSTITVLAKTTDEKFVATTTLEVVENGMEVVYANNTAEVGVTTTLKANVVDAKGNKVDLPTTDTAKMNIVVLDKPTNAYVYADVTSVSSNNKDFSVTFLGSVAGEYKIQTIIVDSNNEFVTGIETIKVGNNEAAFNDVVVVSMGANSMIVNDTVVALDVAPFIENNRTMLQYNVLYVFGIDVQWDGVNSVIAEGNGIKVVMTIGSKVAVVNGEEVALDVAPYVVNGRTVVPVGFITGTFGIDNQIIKAADGSVADILFTK